MKTNLLEKIVLNNLQNRTFEAKRVFHGRGNFYENLNFICVDSFDDTMLVTLYEEDKDEEAILVLLEKIAKNFEYKNLIIQRKYKEDSFFEARFGKIYEDFYIFENSLKYKISFKNRNIGLFLDMKQGREFIKSIAKDKKILNLFSYSCAFSVISIFAKAKMVINVDMSKNSLNLGRVNHQINNLDTKNVKFLPYNILKSLSTFKKEVAFDIVIIDPPSFQKNSFVATKDYEKIIKKLTTLTKKDTVVLACLNDPFLDSNFLIELFKKYASEFEFVRRIENCEDFVVEDEEKALKNLVFIRKF